MIIVVIIILPSRSFSFVASVYLLVEQQDGDNEGDDRESASQLCVIRTGNFHIQHDRTGAGVILWLKAENLEPQTRVGGNLF